MNSKAQSDSAYNGKTETAQRVPLTAVDFRFVAFFNLLTTSRGPTRACAVAWAALTIVARAFASARVTTAWITFAIFGFRFARFSLVD